MRAAGPIFATGPALTCSIVGLLVGRRPADARLCCVRVTGRGVELLPGRPAGALARLPYRPQKGFKMRLARAGRRFTALAAVAAAGLMLAACGGTSASSAVVPSLSQQAGGQPGGTSGSSRATALHAAAQCIRAHGIPGYSDPVLTSSGQVYSDRRSIQDAPQSTIDAIRHACQPLLTQAGLNPENEPPAPPQLVQAGVRAAGCERAHGLPQLRDPTAQTPYTPGHGFGMTDNEVPAGGKASPVFQHAAQSCLSLVEAEIRASTLGSLGNDG